MAEHYLSLSDMNTIMTHMSKNFCSPYAYKDQEGNIIADSISSINDKLENFSSDSLSGITESTDSNSHAFWFSDASKESKPVYSSKCTFVPSTGALTVSGDITGARVFNAVYNDYAEFFEKGEDVEPGDIIALDDTRKDKEQYVRATKDSKVVVGICSDEYGHILGGKQQSEELNKKEFIPVSLMGRVRVKVYGKVKPGDLITVSDIPGIGIKASKDCKTKILGTALTYHDSEEIGKVRILVNA